MALAEHQTATPNLMTSLRNEPVISDLNPTKSPLPCPDFLAFALAYSIELPIQQSL